MRRFKTRAIHVTFRWHCAVRLAVRIPSCAIDGLWIPRSGGKLSQLISMSCPRAGPVGNLFRSMLKNGLTLRPSGRDTEPTVRKTGPNGRESRAAILRRTSDCRRPSRASRWAQRHVSASSSRSSVSMCGAPGHPAAIIERDVCDQRFPTGRRGDAHANPRLDARRCGNLPSFPPALDRRHHGRTQPASASDGILRPRRAARGWVRARRLNPQSEPSIRAG